MGTRVRGMGCVSGISPPSPQGLHPPCATGHAGPSNTQAPLAQRSVGPHCPGSPSHSHPLKEK